MVSVPAFLLRRLYVKKSLKNTPDGFEFHLRNQLGSGYSHGVHPITVDGVELPIGSAVFDLDGDVISFSDVSRDRTLTLALNKTMVRPRSWDAPRSRPPQNRHGLRRPRTRLPRIRLHGRRGG